MSKERKIEELKRHLDKMVGNNSQLKAEKLYAIGYRRQGEVAREIFEEIYEDCFDQFGYINYEGLAELKKKYTEEHK